MNVRRGLGVATVVALALLTAACGGAGAEGVAGGSGATAAPSASPSASPGASAPVADPQVAKILAGGSTHAIRGSEITVTLPKGWTALPLDPKQFVKALQTFMKTSSAAQESLKGQDLDAMAKTFAFFGVKTSSGGVTNVNVVDIGDTTGVSHKEVIAQVKQTLDGLGATIGTVGTKTLPIGEVVYATYTLSVGAQEVNGIQYHLTDREHSLTVTLSTPDLVVNQKAFDAIAQGLREST